MTGTRRDTVLDFLRGYLLFVIIVNHLRDEPHLFMFLTGGTRLWVTAAEGFVLISGFLVGKLRGDEARRDGLRGVTHKVLRRAATLALWTVLISDLLLLLAWATGHSPSVIDSPRGELLGPVAKILLGQVLGYVYGDHNILAAYALFLASTPVILWCLMRGHWLLLGGISVGLWIIGLLTPWPFMLTDSNVADLSWQLLFVIGVSAGFHHARLAAWWTSRSPGLRRGLITAAGVVTAVSLGLTWWRRLAVHDMHRAALEHMLFAHARLGPGRLLLSIVWMLFGYAVVERLRKPLLAGLGWFFVRLGQVSLYVFIVHGLVLFPFAGEPTGSFLMATGHAAFALALIWLLVRFRVLFGVIPR